MRPTLSVEGTRTSIWDDNFISCATTSYDIQRLWEPTGKQYVPQRASSIKYFSKRVFPPRNESKTHTMSILPMPPSFQREFAVGVVMALEGFQ